MRLSRLFVIVFVALLGVATPLKRGCTFEPAQNYAKVKLLQPQLLSSPPAEGTKEWGKQIDAVLQAQCCLSSKELTAIKDEQHVRLEMMTSLFGSYFTRERLPKIFAMLDRVINSTRLAIDADKKFWHTRRPYLTDSRVKLYVDPINDSPAYPSGHTTETRVLAEVLGLLNPEKITALRAHAEAIAIHRVEAGVHYPIDIEGGRILAMLIVGALTASDDFQADLATARKEISSK
ncbi:MAG: phosphatase PAP2 family protein [Chlorobiaceae bacterium]